MAICLLPPQACYASFFKMTLKQNSIYTPGKMHLNVTLTDDAKINGSYQCKVGIYMAGALIRQQTLKVTKKEPAIFELKFPDVCTRTDVRCRSELFLEEHFLEAREKSLTLWPPMSPYPEESINDKKIWTFDTSGKLQELFNDLEVESIDATFQGARDFLAPDIVFIGQNLDPNNMSLITERLVSFGTKPVIVFLRQKQFLRNSKVEVPTENNRSESVECKADCPLLKDLYLNDVLNMVDGAAYIQIKKEKDDKTISINSFITERVKDKRSVYSYLCTVKEKGCVTIYCQLPVTDYKNPRYVTLLKNLLKLTDKISDQKKQSDN